MSIGKLRLIYDVSHLEKTVIEIDGTEVPGVRGIQIDARVDSPTLIKLELVGYELDVEVVGEVEKKWPFPPPKEHIGMTRAALLKAADLHPPVKP